MISEPDKVSKEMNGTSVKAENLDLLKDEVKEEPKALTPSLTDSNMPNNHSGPPSNKLTNGEMSDNNNQPEDTKKVADFNAIKKEEANGEATPSDILQTPVLTPKSQPPAQTPAQSAPAGAPQQPPPISQPINSNMTSMSQSNPTQPTQQHSHQQGGGGEAPFMQHQSQICVFPTQMANEAAESILQGQYKDLISYHRDCPATKKFLQKHSLKLPPFHRSVMPAGMMNPTVRHRSMTNMQPQRGGAVRGFPPQQHPAASVAQWVDQQNANLEQGYSLPPGMSQRGGNFGPGGGNPPQGMMGYGPQGGGPPSSTSPMNFMNPDSFGFDSEFSSMFGNPHGTHPSLQHAKVPNENLTPEQLKRREEQLTNLRKIQQMLFPEQNRQQHYGPGGPNSGGPNPGVPGGMMSEAMHAQMMQQQGMMTSPHGQMMSQQQMMASQEQAMMGSPNSGMMSPAQQHFMMSQGMGQYGGPGPGPNGPGPGPGHPGYGPHNMQNINSAQREWMRLQQEYYLDKRKHHQQQQIAHRMGPGNMADMMGPNPGPPPSYYSSIAQKQCGGPPGGMITSTSPNSNGPLGSPPLMSHGMDPQDHMGGMFDPRQAGPGGMNFQKSMMHGPHGPSGGPQGPHGPPGGPQGLHCPSGGPHGPPGGPGHMHPAGMPTMNEMKNSPQVSVQRAGNPEPFNPEIVRSPTAVTSSSASKPPPSYAQSQKRKRDDMEDWCKNLQPTPSPQQINYLNQFEGQELTITKQLNVAYRETNNTGDSSHSGGQFPSNQVVNSPMHGPGSNKGPMSNSSQTSSGGPLSSPGPMSVPGPSPLSGANMRLSHYEPPTNVNVNNPSHPPSSNNSSSVNVSSAPHTPTSKPVMNKNITSASLANLAKGVETLSHQMQQDMMQGGPFHSIQMQGQQQQQQQQQQQMSSAQQTKTSNHSPICTSAEMSSQTQTTPSVNNTYVNATMSIQQLNIQSVNAPGGPNYNPAMQVQQMNMDQQQQQMNMEQQQQQQQQQMGMPCPSGPPHGNPGVPSGAQGPSVSSMSQAQSMMSSHPPHPGMNSKHPKSPYPGGHHPSQMAGGPGMGPSPGGGPSSVGHGHGPHPQDAGPNPGHGMRPEPSPGQGPGGLMMQPHPQRPTSPTFSNSSAPSVGNANVQIQAKAPNTIQYLPAHPPATQHNMQQSKRPDLDFMQRFAAPMGNVENKVPTSKMQYFPQAQRVSGHPDRNSPFGNPGSCGPMGPGMPGPGMPSGIMQSRGGSMVDFPPEMRAEMRGGPMGPMAGMGSPDHMSGSPMSNHPMTSMSNNVMPGNMPPEAAMMGGNMGMGAEGMMGMDGMPSPGVMGPGMPHPNSPPFMDSHDAMMGPSMMQGGPPHMSPRGHGHMMGPGPQDIMTAGPASRMTAEMANYGPSMSRQPSTASMRMHSQGNPNMPPHPGMVPGGAPGGPNHGPGGGNPAYNAQYQQFQQQLYSQGRPRQMSPMGGGMMQGPGQPYMGMMPNMPGP